MGEMAPGRQPAVSDLRRWALPGVREPSLDQVARAERIGQE